MNEKELICIVCPNGCRINCKTDDNGTVISVEGYTCKRGYDYAIQEVTFPLRTLTSTVEADFDGKKHMIPVRTSHGIPKDKLFDAIEQIRKIKLTSPVKLGQTIVTDFIDKGTDLIACKTVK